MSYEVSGNTMSYEVSGNRLHRDRDWDTLSEALEAGYVVKVEPSGFGCFTVTEAYSDHFFVELTRDQLVAWAHELLAMAGEPEPKSLNR